METNFISYYYLIPINKRSNPYFFSIVSSSIFISPRIYYAKFDFYVEYAHNSAKSRSLEYCIHIPTFLVACGAVLFDNIFRFVVDNIRLFQVHKLREQTTKRNYNIYTI